MLADGFDQYTHSPARIWKIGRLIGGHSCRYLQFQQGYGFLFSIYHRRVLIDLCLFVSSHLCFFPKPSRETEVAKQEILK